MNAIFSETLCNIPREGFRTSFFFSFFRTVLMTESNNANCNKVQFYEYFKAFLHMELPTTNFLKTYLWRGHFLPRGYPKTRVSRIRFWQYQSSCIVHSSGEEKDRRRKAVKLNSYINQFFNILFINGDIALCTNYFTHQLGSIRVILSLQLKTTDAH